jgi:hypothetical protein
MGLPDAAWSPPAMACRDLLQETSTRQKKESTANPSNDLKRIKTGLPPQV